MSLGSLFTLPKVYPFDTGALAPAAELYFYQTGTVTDQSVYTTAALAVAHDQPVLADSDGVFPAIYLNPDAAVEYRVRLSDSASVQIYQEDAVPRRSTNFETDTFTCTYTGFSADPSGTTVTWFRFGNIINMILPVGTGTSNSTSFWINGIPAAIRPSTNQYFHMPYCTDNNAHLVGGAVATINTSGVIQFAPADVAYSITGWTNSSVKGLTTVGTLWYRLDDT